MSSERQTIEAQGTDVEDAIASGLQQLGLDRNDVIVEIVEEGRKGILGLGSKEAVVRLTPMAIPTTRREQAAAEATAPSSARDKDDGADSLDEKAATDDAPATEEREEPRGEYDRELESVVTEIVTNLLAKMGFDDATVRLQRSGPDEKSGRVMTIAHVEGGDLSSLIGPHGETLNDFQYVARLMAGHALRRRADFIVDIDGYRSQRKESLNRLALRMADKAVERGTAVTLEPMSSYDRRLVHMALRDRDDVYTSSVGEGSNRRVRIYLKENA